MPQPLHPPAARKGYLELPLKRLLHAAVLTGAEQDAVRTLDASRRTTPKGGTIVSPQAAGFHFLLEGWACRQREVAPGRRQLFDLILPGDVVGPLPDDEGVAPYSCVALTSVITTDATVLAGRGADGRPTHPGIMAALISLRAQVQARLLDHVVRLGARSAYDGLAHLLLELHDRLTVVGLTSGGRLPFPLGYERIGDLLGLSEVHVGRTLTKLKADGHLLIGPGRLTLPRMQELADQVGYAATLSRTCSRTYSM